MRLQTAVAKGVLVKRRPLARRACSAVVRCRAALLALPRHAAAELAGKSRIDDI